MVIQCPKCNTRFKLPIDRVRPGGVRVRCSECRHIFPIQPTDVSAQSPSAQDTAGSDLWDDSFAAPGTERPERASGKPASAPQPPAVRGERKPGLNEADLGLDDLAAPIGGKLAEPEEPEESFDEFGFEEDSVIDDPFADAGKKPLSAAAFFPEEAAEDQESDLPEFSFEQAGLETFSFDVEEEGAAPKSSPAVNSFFAAAQTDDKKTDLFGGPFTPPPTGGATEKAADDSERFFDFNMSFGASPPNDLNRSLTAAEDIVVGPLGKGKSAGQRQMSSAAEFDVSSYRLGDGRKRRGPVATVLRLFFMLFVLLGGIVGYLFWKNDTTDINRILALVSGGQPTETQVPQIRLPLPKSFYIKNRNVGQLFVIYGEAVNDYPEARSAIAVKGMLHDKQGNVLSQQTVYCGNSMNQETLRTASFAKLEADMNNQFGNTLSNLNVEPGKAIPYMIVFRNLPPNVTEFTVEVADSQPGVSQ